MRLLLGIDLGTQGTKAALYAEDGRCVAENFCPSQPHRPAVGEVEEDPEHQVASVISTIRHCLGQPGVNPGDVTAMAIVGQMAGVLGIDASGRAVTPYDSWLDTRCGAHVARMQAEAGEEVLGKTGHAPSFNHGPKILWWQKERPVDFTRIRSFVQPAAYATMRLCGLEGNQAFIDHTYLHFSGFADNQQLSWDQDLCRRFSIDPAKLPAIVPPASIVGRLTSAMASACGLPPDLPLVAGAGDTAASFLACGACAEGICVDVAGTASVFSATTRAFVPDTVSRMLGCGRSVIPGLWHPYAYINGGGQNLEWFRHTVLGGTSTFEMLSPEGGTETHDAHLPYFVPHLGGRVCPPTPGLRGAWVGLHWNTSATTLFRSVLEGVALEYALYRDALLKLLPSYSLREIRVTGGGEKNPVWNQLKADRLQARVCALARPCGGPMGAALLAGHGAGMFPDLATTATQWATLGRIYVPDSSQASLSRERIKRYVSLVNRLEGWTEEQSL